MTHQNPLFPPPAFSTSGNTVLAIHSKSPVSSAVTNYPPVTHFSFDLAFELDSGAVRLGKTSPSKAVCREDDWERRLPLEAGQRD